MSLVLHPTHLYDQQQALTQNEVLLQNSKENTNLERGKLKNISQETTAVSEMLYKPIFWWWHEIF